MKADKSSVLPSWLRNGEALGGRAESDMPAHSPMTVGRGMWRALPEGGAGGAIVDDRDPLPTRIDPDLRLEWAARALNLPADLGRLGVGPEALRFSSSRTDAEREERTPRMRKRLILQYLE